MKMADSIDLDDDDPSTSGSRVTCHVCRHLVSQKQNGTFCVHGPRDHHCQGSSLSLPEQTRASLPFHLILLLPTALVFTHPLLLHLFSSFDKRTNRYCDRHQHTLDTLWNGIIRLNGMQFDLPGGAVERAFVELLTTEIGKLT